MKYSLNLRNYGNDESHLVRLRFEPMINKYILAYSDDLHLRVADAKEVGELASFALYPKRTAQGALASPLVAQIAATSACNLQCSFCYAELKKGNAHTMNTSDIIKILQTLKQYGVIYLEWAGGEPFLNQDFLIILQYAYRLNFKQSVLTNGTKLCTDFFTYAHSFVNTVQISIDDIGEHFNKLKGSGSWDDLESNLRLAVNAGLPIVASLVLNKQNARRLGKIVKYIWESGIRFARISWQVPMGEAKETSLEEYRRLVEQTRKEIHYLQQSYRGKGLLIFALQEQSNDDLHEFPREFLLCSAARTRLYIDWNGDVYPCPVLKYPEFRSGNILLNNFEDIWHSNVWDEIRNVTNGPECKTCKLFCSYWCRAIVYGFTKNISLTPSPLCPRARHINKK